MSWFFFKKSKATIIFLILFSGIVIPVFYYIVKVDDKVKRYNPSDVNPQLVDTSIRSKNKNHKVADFKLINQNGKTITNEDYIGKIYIADFFFTRCQTICIAMAYNMSELQEFYKKDQDVMFLSHSVTPRIDSVSVLKEYAERKGVIDGKWNVTTGSKKHIYSLARKSYMVVQESGDGGENDFIHTENFVLIDKERRICGYYDGTKKEDIEKLKKDIFLLKEEYASN